MPKTLAALRHLALGVLDIAMPRTCQVCGMTLTMTERHICLTCLAALPRASFHLNPYNRISTQLLPFCADTRAACWLFYSSPSAVSDIVHTLKYKDNPDLARYMGARCAEEVAGDGFFRATDIIVPVPMHWFKKLRRHYNQAYEIAMGISHVTGLPVTDVMRARRHASQARLTRSQRGYNAVAGIYSVSDPSALCGKRVLIVDDITTTGATLRAVAASLRRDCPEIAGIDVLTLGVTENI